MAKVTYTPIKEGDLTKKDIGKPLLFNNKGDNQYGILTAIRNETYIEVHYAGNTKSMLQNYVGMFKTEIL